MSRLWVSLLFLCPAVQAEIVLQGRVVSDTGQPVAGAGVTIRMAGAPTGPRLVSDASGGFQAALPQPGSYSIDIDREGFFRLANQPLELAEAVTEMQFALNPVREVVETLDVKENPSFVDMDRTAPQMSLSGADLMNVPYPSTNTLRNALRIMPGMVQDSRGGVHLYGGAEEQTLYTLEGFQINDPLTGRFESRISVEGVQSMETTAGRPRAEFGKGSSGVLSLRSRTGDDKLRYSATNFVPGVEYQKGLIIGGWNPRLNVSGPWKRGRAWFSNSLSLQYVNGVIPELPRGEDRVSAWRWSNLLHNQINLTSSNILTIGSLTNFWYAPRTGLSALNPRETTVDRRSRQFFTYIKDQIYFGRGMLLEAGYSHNRTDGREIPQGEGTFIVTPIERRGFYFIDARREGGRDQWLANLFLPTFQLFGEHQFKGGIDLDRLFYWQDVRRTAVEFTTFDFTPVRRTFYKGDGRLRRNNFEASTYLQDSWRVRPGLLLDLGMRADWDTLLRNWNFSPRLGFAWSPAGRETTKISGGYARIFDSTSLRLFTRPLDQFSVSEYYDAGGGIIRGPAYSLFQIPNPNLASPRYHNWSLGVEHQFPKMIQARGFYIVRRGTRGFTYLNGLNCDCIDIPQQFDGVTNPLFDAIYTLGTARRDRYDAVELTLRQPIRGQYQWMLSYTRSKARSNAVVDQSIDEPLLIGDNAGRLPWDAPNRWLSWGFLPTPFRNWSAAWLAEYRTGFPFSVQDVNGQVVGAVNELRFPVFFELNLHLERRLGWRGQWWAVRGGFNNVTNHKNPNVVNNVIGSPQFLAMYGGQTRAFNVRVRWLGKQ